MGTIKISEDGSMELRSGNLKKDKTYQIQLKKGIVEGIKLKSKDMSKERTDELSLTHMTVLTNKKS